MSILTCARRHRSLLWYSRAQRAYARRHHLRTAKRGAGAVACVGHAASSSSSAALALTKKPLSTALVPLTAVRATSTLAHMPQSKPESAARADASPPSPKDEEGSSPSPDSSWSAMLIALFAMIQPEWAKEVRQDCAVPDW
jgi:hypothetical protein